jgi:hypothetical protein
MVDSKAVKPLGELRQLMAILKLSTGQEGRPRDRAQLLTLVGLEIHILTKEQRSLNCKLILQVAQTKGFTKTLKQLREAVFLFPFGIILELVLVPAPRLWLLELAQFHKIFQPGISGQAQNRMAQQHSAHGLHPIMQM